MTLSGNLTLRPLEGATSCGLILSRGDGIHPERYRLYFLQCSMSSVLQLHACSAASSALSSFESESAFF